MAAFKHAVGERHARLEADGLQRQAVLETRHAPFRRRIILLQLSGNKVFTALKGPGSQKLDIRGKDRFPNPGFGETKLADLGYRVRNGNRIKVQSVKGVIAQIFYSFLHHYF